MEELIEKKKLYFSHLNTTLKKKTAHQFRWDYDRNLRKIRLPQEIEKDIKESENLFLSSPKILFKIFHLNNLFKNCFLEHQKSKKQQINNEEEENSIDYLLEFDFNEEESEHESDKWFGRQIYSNIDHFYNLCEYFCSYFTLFGYDGPNIEENILKNKQSNFYFFPINFDKFLNHIIANSLKNIDPTLSYQYYKKFLDQILQFKNDEKSEEKMIIYDYIYILVGVECCNMLRYYNMKNEIVSLTSQMIFEVPSSKPYLFAVLASFYDERKHPSLSLDFWEKALESGMQGEL